MTKQIGVVTYSERAPNSLVTATNVCRENMVLFCLVQELDSCQNNLFENMSVLIYLRHCFSESGEELSVSLTADGTVI